MTEENQPNAQQTQKGDTVLCPVYRFLSIGPHDSKTFYWDIYTERTLCSSDPRSHKRIGQILRDFAHTIWECKRENAVLAGIFRQV